MVSKQYSCSLTSHELTMKALDSKSPEGKQSVTVVLTVSPELPEILADDSS